MSTPRSRARGLLGLGTALLLVLGLLGALPAAAAVSAPTGLSPSGGTVSAVPILSWSRVAGADRYRVQVSTSPSYADLVVDDETVNSRLVPTRQLPSGTLYWRVRAIDSAGAGDWAPSSFERAAVPAPTPVGPEDGAQLAQPSQAALLSWTPVPGAGSYRVEIDDAVDFIGARSYDTRTTALVVPDPQVKTIYYWRVRADLGSGLASQWSSTRSYRILGLAKPTNPVPADDANLQIEDVVLEWDPVPGAHHYQLRVSTDERFLTLDGGFQDDQVKSTRFSPRDTLDNDQYYWQVRPVDAHGNAPTGT